MPDFTASDGARLHYSDEGEGLPLLCLSGLTRTGADFDYLAPHLPPVIRMIRMDYRGRGQSDWTGAATYTIPQEALDVLALLDHLNLPEIAILGTSRGGLVGLWLAATARPRLTGLCLNDVGPVIDPAGLARIAEYVGRNPAARSFEDAARGLATQPGFRDVAPERWLEEARTHYDMRDGRLVITYDPALRDAFAVAQAASAGDAWPLFDACAGLPLGLIRGEGSDLLSRATADEMRRRRPDMVFAEVLGRGHIPFLDEPAAIRAIHDWLGLIR
jgi:pimeloyl-ACP methyl ester carboxylesterase